MAEAIQRGMMKLSPALGFLVIGWLLGQVPAWAPDWCAVNGSDDARLLWLQLMSRLQFGLAAAHGWPVVGGALARWMRYAPESAAKVRSPQPADGPVGLLLLTRRRVAKSSRRIPKTARPRSWAESASDWRRAA